MEEKRRMRRYMTPKDISAQGWLVATVFLVAITSMAVIPSLRVMHGIDRDAQRISETLQLEQQASAHRKHTVASVGQHAAWLLEQCVQNAADRDMERFVVPAPQDGVVMCTVVEDEGSHHNIWADMTSVTAGRAKWGGCDFVATADEQQFCARYKYLVLQCDSGRCVWHGEE